MAISSDASTRTSTNVVKSEPKDNSLTTAISTQYNKVTGIATLANLILTPSETLKFSKQLDEILNYVKILEKANTEKVEETSQVTGLENVTRNDETSPSLSQEEALSNTKSQHNGFFKVKGIFNEE